MGCRRRREELELTAEAVPCVTAARINTARSINIVSTLVTTLNQNKRVFDGVSEAHVAKDAEHHRPSITDDSALSRGSRVLDLGSEGGGRAPCIGCCQNRKSIEGVSGVDEGSHLEQSFTLVSQRRPCSRCRRCVRMCCGAESPRLWPHSMSTMLHKDALLEMGEWPTAVEGIPRVVAAIHTRGISL